MVLSSSPVAVTTKYIVEITTQKNEKYLSEGRNPLACSPARLLVSCQLRNFPRDFTEKCFAVFDQSLSHVISVAPIFPGIFFYHSFHGMTLRF